MQDNKIKLKDGRSLGYSDYGNPDAIPVMLFHGTPGSRICGLEENPMLNSYGIRNISPERPGYGLSDPKPDRTIIDWTNDVKELADQLGLNEFHIAGESGGGAYVLACAANISDRILSSTLIGSICPPEILESTKGMTLGNKIGFFLAKNIPFLMKWSSTYFAASIKKYPEKIMSRMIDQLCDWDKQIIENGGAEKITVLLNHFVEAFRQGNIGHFEDSLLLANSWGFDFNEIKCPIFLWHGDDDNLVPVIPAKEFSKILQNCESHFIPNGGHFLLESEVVGSKIIEKILSVK